MPDDIPRLMRIRDWATSYENNRTRELKRMDYILVPNRMDTDGYTKLMDHDNAAAHLGAWIAILQIASRSKQRGTIEMGAGIPQLAARLSRISRIPVSIYEEVFPRLISEVEWIELDPDIKQGAEKPQATQGAEKPQVGAGKSFSRARTGPDRKGEGDDADSFSESSISNPPPVVSTRPKPNARVSTGVQEALLKKSAPSPNAEPPALNQTEHDLRERATTERLAGILNEPIPPPAHHPPPDPVEYQAAVDRLVDYERARHPADWDASLFLEKLTASGRLA